MQAELRAEMARTWSNQDLESVVCFAEDRVGTAISQAEAIARARRSLKAATLALYGVALAGNGLIAGWIVTHPHL